MESALVAEGGRGVLRAKPHAWCGLLLLLLILSRPCAAQPAPNDWMDKAAVLDGRADWEGLVHHAQRWTQAAPNDAQAWYNLGLAMSNLGQPAESVQACTRALELRPESAQAWYVLGLAPDRPQGARQGLLAHTARPWASKPDFALAWYNLGVLSKALGQPTQGRGGLPGHPEAATPAGHGLVQSGFGPGDSGPTGQGRGGLPEPPWP